MANFLTDNKGFFQGGKSFGGKGLFGETGVLSGAIKKLGQGLKDKPCAGQPGVCPYTCKPLQTPQEKQEGISGEAKAQGAPPEMQAGANAGAMGMPSLGQQPSQYQGSSTFAIPQSKFTQPPQGGFM